MLPVHASVINCFNDVSVADADFEVRLGVEGAFVLLVLAAFLNSVISSFLPFLGYQSLQR